MAELPACGICLGELRAPTVGDACAHVFCGECLGRWAERRNSCPVCRKPLQRDTLALGPTLVIRRRRRSPRQHALPESLRVAIGDEAQALERQIENLLRGLFGEVDAEEWVGLH